MDAEANSAFSTSPAVFFLLCESQIFQRFCRPLSDTPPMRSGARNRLLSAQTLPKLLFFEFNSLTGLELEIPLATSLRSHTGSGHYKDIRMMPGLIHFDTVSYALAFRAHPRAYRPLCMAWLNPRIHQPVFSASPLMSTQSRMVVV